MARRSKADGNARQEPKSKHVGAFRKFAKLINPADKDLENILIRNIDNANYSGTAKENIITLQQGAKEIFKKDIQVYQTFLMQEILTLLQKAYGNFCKLMIRTTISK